MGDAKGVSDGTLFLLSSLIELLSKKYLPFFLDFSLGSLPYYLTKDLYRVQDVVF